MAKPKPKKPTLKILDADLGTVEAQQDIFQNDLNDLTERVQTLEDVIFQSPDPEPLIPPDEPEPEEIGEAEFTPESKPFKLFEGKFGWIEFGLGVATGAVLVELIRIL